MDSGLGPEPTSPEQLDEYHQVIAHLDDASNAIINDDPDGHGHVSFNDMAPIPIPDWTDQFNDELEDKLEPVHQLNI